MIIGRTIFIHVLALLPVAHEICMHVRINANAYKTNAFWSICTIGAFVCDCHSRVWKRVHMHASIPLYQHQAKFEAWWLMHLSRIYLISYARTRIAWPRYMSYRVKRLLNTFLVSPKLMKPGLLWLLAWNNYTHGVPLFTSLHVMTVLLCHHRRADSVNMLDIHYTGLIFHYVFKLY